MSRFTIPLPLSDNYCSCLWTGYLPKSMLLLGFQHFLTAQVIRVAFYIKREKSDKFFSEALISAWGSFTCSKSTTRDQRLYLFSEGSHTQDFFSEKIRWPRPGLNPRTSYPVVSKITTGSPGSTNRKWGHTTSAELKATQLTFVREKSYNSQAFLTLCQLFIASKRIVFEECFHIQNYQIVQLTFCY